MRPVTGRPALSRRRLLVATLAALSVAGVALAVADRARSAPPPRALEIEMAASAGTFAQVFWGVDQNFAEDRSFRAPLQPTPGRFQLLRLTIPPEDVPWLRFDPIDTAGEVSIRQARVVDSKGTVLATLGPEHFRPLIPTVPLIREGGVARVVTTSAGERPSVLIAFGCVDRSSLWGALSRFTPTALALASMAALALVVAGVAVIGVEAFRRGLPAMPGWRSRSTAWAGLTALVGLFLVVFSAKLLFLGAYHVTVPYWDEWVMPGDLFLPYHECSLSWRQMFHLHNEHRVFFTRLLSLALLAVNGQWEPRLQQVVNAAIHGLAAVLLAAVLWRASERRRLALLAFICAVTFALPFSWENTLSGFQSQFYFQLLFFVLALWLTTTYRAGTRVWCLGWCCAVCGLFTAGGGVMTPVAIAAVVAVKWVHDRAAWRESLATLAAAAAVLALGIAVASPPIPGHAHLKAQTTAEFARALGRNLAWPWVDHPELSVVAWLPVAALLVVIWRNRSRATALESLIVGLTVWVVLQAAAIAYGRGVGGQAPVPRYQDFLSLGFVANAMALLAALDRLRGPVARLLVRGAFVCWLVLALVGVYGLLTKARHDVDHYRHYWSDYASNIRRFVITGDLAEFASKRPHREVPHPDPRFLAGILQDPYLRRILPTAVREPVRLQPRLVTDAAFVLNGTGPTTPGDPLARTWGSFTALGNLAQGRFESEPVTPCQLGGRLQFLMAGDPGISHQSLTLRDLRSGRVLEVSTRESAREQWISVLVPCPGGPYAVIAVDARSDGWFAFREPVEVGWASRAAEALIARSATLLAAALAVTVLAACWKPLTDGRSAL